MVVTARTETVLMHNNQDHVMLICTFKGKKNLKYKHHSSQSK